MSKEKKKFQIWECSKSIHRITIVHENEYESREKEAVLKQKPEVTK